MNLTAVPIKRFKYSFSPIVWVDHQIGTLVSFSISASEGYRSDHVSSTTYELILVKSKKYREVSATRSICVLPPEHLITVPSPPTKHFVVQINEVSDVVYFAPPKIIQFTVCLFCMFFNLPISQYENSHLTNLLSLTFY